MNNSVHIIRFIVFLLFLVGLYLRIQAVIDEPLWIDEAKTAMVGIGEQGGREFLQVLYYNLLDVESEFWLRFPVIVLSSLTVLGLYMVGGKRAIPFCILIALHPYFVFWGSLSRPYAIGAFFTVLGAKNKWFYIPAIMATPFSIVGLNLWEVKNRWKYYLVLAIWAVAWYKLMPLSGSDHFNMEFLSNAKRLWYIPLVSLFVHLILFDADKLSRLRAYFFRLVKSG